MVKHSFSSLLAVLGWQMHMPLRGDHNDVLSTLCPSDLLPLLTSVGSQKRQRRKNLPVEWESPASVSIHHLLEHQ